jgi:hypothetical protein
MILVFKTDVSTIQRVLQLKNTLNKMLAYSKWNFDLEDCDNIFRVEGENISSFAIVNMMQDLGLECEELPD